MNGTEETDGEKENYMTRLISAETLAAKKAEVYSHLLTDMALAGEMETLSQRHIKRKEALENLLGEEK